MLAGAAIYVGRAYLNPAAEESQRKKSVLTGAMDPRLIEVTVLQDSDLPEDHLAIGVGSH